ncbi:hypothetical protein D8L93_10725 [Sodalis-like symbiont of Bactericera trigonica]|nr:hypothetical protein D8L93_10725 [Sodalis-like symbiont of Bactericera trigonica]
MAQTQRRLPDGAHHPGDHGKHQHRDRRDNGPSRTQHLGTGMLWLPADGADRLSLRVGQRQGGLMAALKGGAKVKRMRIKLVAMA